jgi:hypothetical protein
MTSKGDRSFPCLLRLSEPSSEQGYEFQQRSGVDYVFFPASDFQEKLDRWKRQPEGKALLKLPDRPAADV